MKSSRRSFIRTAAMGTAAAGLGLSCSGGSTTPEQKVSNASKNNHRNRIGVSTYSFWQFNGPKEDSSIEMCIEQSAAMGFDGIEFLLMQMQSEENSYLQKLKKQAFYAGLDIMGFSTHQGFVYPEKETRDSEVVKTIHQIELAYQKNSSQKQYPIPAYIPLPRVE